MKYIAPSIVTLYWIEILIAIVWSGAEPNALKVLKYLSNTFEPPASDHQKCILEKFKPYWANILLPYNMVTAET